MFVDELVVVIAVSCLFILVVGVSSISGNWLLLLFVDVTSGVVDFEVFVELVGLMFFEVVLVVFSLFWVCLV